MEMLAVWASKKEKEEMVTKLTVQVRCYIEDDAECCLVRQKMWGSLLEVLLHT